VRQIFRFLLVGVTVTLPAIGADLQTGVNAVKNGDYATALRELKPLAEKDEPLAQVMLGLMYYQGKGVQQDYKEALQLYLRAADQGEATAQMPLGVMYGTGQGIEQDLVEAYMRFSLCLSDPEVGANCAKNREGVSHLMTPAQIVEAQGLAKTWKPKAKTDARLTNSASLPNWQVQVGYMSIQGVTGLTEFSQAQYAIIERQFEGEQNFNAPSLEFLNRRWNVAIGTVGGNVYKIVLFLDSASKDAVSNAAADVVQYCQQRLGKPSEQHDGTFIWDTVDGSVMLRSTGTLNFYQVNLIETSRAASRFTLKP
jgi:hypothetical protein